MEVTLSSRGYEVTALTDARATRAAVIVAIQAVALRADGDDLVLVHFSCHGQIVGDRPYLLLHDTPRGDKSVVQKGLRLTEALAALHRGARGGQPCSWMPVTWGWGSTPRRPRRRLGSTTRREGSRSSPGARRGRSRRTATR